MSEQAQEIEALLKARLKPISLHVEDQSWQHAGHAGAKETGGGHFRVAIVAACFAGLSRIQRHRLVYEALKDKFGPAIHALSIHARVPGEEAAK